MSREPTLDHAAWSLLTEALEIYRDSRPAADRLRHSLHRLEEPLTVAVAGPWRSGKSTLVNALVGEQVAPVTAAAGEQVYTWYQDGTEPHAIAYPAGAELPVSRAAGGMSVDTSQWRPEPVNDVVVTWPSRTLRNATLVDTPALPAGLLAGGPAGAGAAATADRILRDADAVLYLTRDARGTDLDFLERAQGSAVARAAPVNILLVLSRADELGGGKVDALVTARQLARRQHRDPRVGSRCLGVAAVSGLVALGGRVLDEPDLAALTAIAGTDRDRLAGALLSADRFTGADFPAPVAVAARRRLLDRLGLFGVRLALTLVRTGHDSRATLAAELVRRAGLTDLREAIARCLVDRREVLKARSALVALESVLRTEPRPGAEKLFAGLERILANAHELRELRLLAALAGQRVTFPGELAAEARRLAGQNGTGLPARLGVDHQATAAEQWRLGGDALARWQEQAEDPLLTLDQRRTAAVVVRCCEEILSRLRTAR